jgi:hypothetical protein
MADHVKTAPAVSLALADRSMVPPTSTCTGAAMTSVMYGQFSALVTSARMVAFPREGEEPLAPHTMGTDTLTVAPADTAKGPPLPEQTRPNTVVVPKLTL